MIITWFCKPSSFVVHLLLSEEAAAKFGHSIKIH